MKENAIKNKSKKFAIRIINLYKFLYDTQKEYVLSKQILRSGTSIGANVRESEHAQSDLDFLHKVNIALKEANKTQYWLELLFETNFIGEKQFVSINNDCSEICKLLISITKTLKFKNQ